MPGSVFLDTNILIYAIENAGPAKSSIAYGGVRVENPFRS